MRKAGKVLSTTLRKFFIQDEQDFLKKTSKILSKILIPSDGTVEGPNDIEGAGMKIINQSKKIGFWTKLDFFLRLSLSVHTDSRTEA